VTTYLTGAVNDLVQPHAKRVDLGLLYTPDTADYAKHREAFGTVALDNACFSQAKRFDPERYWDFLATHEPGLFATLPDVVGDHEATLARSLPWVDAIRQLGHRAAFVVQNGATVDTVPWDRFDVLFVGGVLECRPCGFTAVPGCEESSELCRVCLERGYERPYTTRPGVCKHCPYCDRRMTEWKTSAAAVELIDEAHRRSMHVHVGRVNGGARFAWCVEHGVETADGTYLGYGPAKNLPNLLSWLNGQWERIQPRLAIAA
jgi:hypothetical protein